MNPIYPSIARRALNRCEYCRAPEVIYNFPFEVEHIVPKAHDGTNDGGNLALACHACNLYKSDALMALDTSTGQQVALFHPRRDFWDEHFHLDIPTGEIKGTTPMGRATASQLQMNTRFQTEARLLWIRLGIFP